MNYIEKLQQLINKKNGIITTKEVVELGIPRQYLNIFIEKNILERLERGTYITPGTFEDEMYILQKKFQKIVFSHETALYLHNLTDRDPINYSVTLPQGYNLKNLEKYDVNIHWTKKENYDLGLTKSKTNFGREIKVYDKERTICDIVKNRNNMDKDLFKNSLKAYISNKDKNLNKLIEYSKKLKIEKVLRKYLEMILWKI